MKYFSEIGVILSIYTYSIKILKSYGYEKGS